MDYKLHTQERYLERYKEILTDDNYFELCEICRKQESWLSNTQVKRGASRILIMYNNHKVTCIVSRKKKIVKTVLHLTKKDKNLNYG